MKPILLFVFVLISMVSLGQSDPYVDSLKALLKTNITDKQRVKTYNDLAEYIVDEKTWMSYNRKSMDLARKKLKSAKGKTRRFYLLAVADAYNNYGYYYDNHDDKENALKYYFKALNLFKEQGDMEGKGGVMNNIGVMLSNQGDFEEAHDYLVQALDIKKKIDPSELAKNYMNLGVNYDKRGDTSSAMRNYRLGLIVAKKSNDYEDIATIYNNIGSIYHGAKRYDSAVPYLTLSVKNYRLAGDEIGEIWSSANLGSSYVMLGNEDSSSYYLFRAFRLSKYYNIASVDQMIAEKLHIYYKLNEDWYNSLKYMEIQARLKDSLSDVQAQKEALRQKLKFDSKVEKAELKAKQNADRAKDRQRMWFIGIVAALLVVFLLIVYSRLRVTRKQKETIEKQKDEIEDQNHEIVDSMNSAKRLQEAMLPSEQELLGEYDDGMLVYLPKDIVAGDFYWSHKDSNGDHHFAVADCTGHGVPGALMSVACANALNQAVKEEEGASPGQILDRTNELVIAYFEANQEEIKNGMDIAYCKWSPKSRELEFSGAYNPLWVWKIKEREWEIAKGDRQPIGNFDKRMEFTSHKMDIGEDCWIYLFSDGFHDQFGGENGKKLKSSGFKRLVESNLESSGEIQKSELMAFFKDWKGSEEQIDDVCVLAIKLSA